MFNFLIRMHPGMLVNMNQQDKISHERKEEKCTPMWDERASVGGSPMQQKAKRERGNVPTLRVPYQTLLSPQSQEIIV